jgi:hypothetical protein
MGTMARTPLRAIAVMSLSLLWGFAQAQDSEPYTADPPDRAARLSYISGNVSLQPVGEEEWAPALVNRPLTTGDKLWTERNARAEIYVGPAAVRLDDETAFSFLNVDDDTIQMRVTAGVINVTVRNLDDREHIEIDTPNVALSLLRAGSYRVEVNDAGDSTVVKVREGQLQATGPSQDTVLYAEQAVTFIGTDDLVARHTAPGAPDDFDSWSFDRDRADERAASSETAEYVSPQVTGYQDLNDNGSWSSEPEYGYVWTPRYVGVDWAPYRYGRWVTVAPWGYTWIDDAPLGLRAVSLRSLGAHSPALVLGAGAASCACGVCAGARGLGWPLRRQRRVVPARAARSLRARAPLQPAIRGAREHREHHRESSVSVPGLRSRRQGS